MWYPCHSCCRIVHKQHISEYLHFLPHLPQLSLSVFTSTHCLLSSLALQCPCLGILLGTYRRLLHPWPAVQETYQFLEDVPVSRASWLQPLKDVPRGFDFLKLISASSTGGVAKSTMDVHMKATKFINEIFYYFIPIFNI